MSHLLLPTSRMVCCAFLALLICSGYAGTAQTPFESLNYLYSIQGSNVIGGMHNRQLNANPNSYSQQLNNITGNWPGLYSADFQFEPNEIANRQTMVNQVINEWNNGAMINIMWHACNPALGEPCYWDNNGVLSQMSDWEWSQLITDGTAINNSWKSRMDEVAYYLQQLEDAGVEVFFRPLHEMNQAMFWWGGRSGPNGTARLYQITHDYFTYEKGLSNLIWVWNLQDFSSLASDLNSYDPGGQYWDVLTLDMYWTDGQGYTTAKYNAMANKAGNKPMGIGECQDLPAVSILQSQPKWSFFMGWSELTFQHNTNQKIQEIYWSGRVITLNEMPGWGNGGSGGNINLAYQRPVTVSSTESPYSASNAVDGDGNTRWASQYADQQNFVIDLGANYNISRVRIAWEAAYGRDYQIQFSTNNSTWTTARSVWGNTGLENDLTGLSGTARYVKMYGITRATSYGFSMYEMEVYGTPASGTFASENNLKNGRIEKNIQAKDIITAFPNPFTENITMQLNLEQEIETVVTVYDLLGKTVAKIPTGKLQAGQNEIIIDTDGWAEGIYNYVLEIDGGRVSNKMIKR